MASKSVSSSTPSSTDQTPFDSPIPQNNDENRTAREIQRVFSQVPSSQGPIDRSRINELNKELNQLLDSEGGNRPTIRSRTVRASKVVLHGKSSKKEEDVEQSSQPSAAKRSRLTPAATQTGMVGSSRQETGELSDEAVTRNLQQAYQSISSRMGFRWVDNLIENLSPNQISQQISGVRAGLPPSTLLIAATAQGRLSTVKELLKRGAKTDVEGTYEFGKKSGATKRIQGTPLSIARQIIEQRLFTGKEGTQKIGRAHV